MLLSRRGTINRASKQHSSTCKRTLQPRFTLWVPESRNSRRILGLNYDKEAKRSSSHDTQLEDYIYALAAGKRGSKGDEICRQAGIETSAHGLLGWLFKPDSANGNDLAADTGLSVL